MLGVIVNAVAVILSSLLGLLLKRGINKKISDAVMTGVGLCVVFIAVGGLIITENVEAVSVASVVSIVLGAILGTLIDIDKALNSLGQKIADKTKIKNHEDNNVAAGFVNTTLFVCVGAMAIFGSFAAGLKGDNTTLYIKSILDFTSVLMFATTFGIGVIFSAIPLTVYQGTLTLGAGLVSPYLTNGAIDSITCTGSIVLIGLALNLLGVTKIKVANYLPAIFVSPFLYYLFDYILNFVR